MDTGDDERPHRHRLKPHRYHTEANLRQARAPLITIDDASPLSSPDASAARSYRPQPPLGIDDDGDHQGGPTPHLAFAEPPPPLLAGTQGAAGALVSQASAATTRPHARTSGAYDNPQQQQHHARQEQYRQYQRQYQHEHPLEELRQQQQQQEPHQHSQRPHPALARAESAPALPPMTPPAHSSLAAIERAFPSSSSAAQPDRPPRLPPLCEAADEGLEACAGEKRRNRMARVRERRAADKTASHAVLYFPDRTEESVIGELDRPRHHDRHQHDQEQHHHHHHQFHRHSKEAKSNPFEVAHFPPPRLYGSSRLSSALPPGSPCPAAAADVDVGHRRETRAEGNTKTDEEEQLPDFPFPVSPPDTWALMRSLEQLYRDGRTAINRDTIVGRKLYNFRDLSEATQSAKHGVKVASQRIFRSACLSRGDVDHVDVAKSLIYLKEFVQVKTMIDFRNKDERMSDPLDPVVDAVYPRIKKGTFMDPSSCKRYNIPLMNKSFKIMGLFLPSKWGTKMNMVKAVVYGSEKTPTEIFAEEAMNPMGLLGLNKLMLVYGKEEIAQVLRICANSSNYPIMYHCSSGKDRTGLITALILLCCGVDAQDIITNYHQSEIFLSPVMDRITAENQAKGLNAGFDGTPPEVMEQTIGYIFEKWGSITGYFSYIGFGSRDQMKLVQHLAHNSRK